MPRIPRRSKGGEQDATPPGHTAPADPHPYETSPGEPVAATSPSPAEQPTSVLEPVPAGAGEEPAAGPEGSAAGEPAEQATPRFSDRSRLRRRARHLRRRRELAFRDLGGLVFDLHRFGRERGDLVAQKLEGLAAIDGELRAIEGALGDRRGVTELREPGVAACPHCQTLHDVDANFCPGCGASLRGPVAPPPEPAAPAPQDGSPDPAPSQSTPAPS